MSSTSDDVPFRSFSFRVKSLKLTHRIVMTRLHAVGASPARATPLIFDGALKDRLTSSCRREGSSVGLHFRDRSESAGRDHLIERGNFYLIAVGRALISASRWAEKVSANHRYSIRRFDPTEIGELV